MALVYAHKLKKLLDAQLKAGHGVAAYRNQFRGLLGLVEQDSGDQAIDASQAEISAKDVSLQDVAHSFLGPGYRDVLPQVGRMVEHFRLREAEGHVVLPSHFSNISAFLDTIGGLIDALVMEAYQMPEFIGDQLFETQEARVNGGKMIGVRNDGGVNETSLLEGEAYPTVGLQEAWVDVPNNERFGNVIQINERCFLYDLTGQVQQMATSAGEAVRRKKEIRQADTFLGITNTYARDNAPSTTYLSAAGALPNNYVNASQNDLVDWEDIDEAANVLEGNVDPSTGFEISVDRNFDLAIMPQRFLRASTIVKQVTVERLTQGGNMRSFAPDPLFPLNLIRLSRLFYNRLVLSGVSATNAVARWHMGNFRRAFKYRQIVPFQTIDAPLSSEDTRRDIVMIRVARELGVPFVAEPRWSYQGRLEA